MYQAVLPHFGISYRDEAVLGYGPKRLFVPENVWASSMSVAIYLLCTV